MNAISYKGIVGIGSDHGGLQLKRSLVDVARGWGLEVDDVGTNSSKSVDYPDFAATICRGVLDGKYGLAVLVCGTGIGMSMMANRFCGIRAAVCTSAYTARMAREHNDANVLCLGERVTGLGEAHDILATFLSTPFGGGRHARRIEKFEQLCTGVR